MNRLMKRVWGITTVALLALTGCASTTTAAPAATTSAPASSSSATEPSQEQKDALLAYVKTQRATVPNLMANMDEVYSEVYSEGTADGKFEKVLRTRDGRTVVVWNAHVTFEYRYVPDYDLSVAERHIEASRAQLERLCETETLPDIRAFGVDTPITVTFRYRANSIAERILSVGIVQCSTF